jgi:hypothetical protein
VPQLKVTQTRQAAQTCNPAKGTQAHGPQRKESKSGLTTA